jgi:hypothetical protein
MRVKKALILSALTLCFAGAQAADWSDTSIGYRYAPSVAQPAVSHKIATNIYNVTHVSGDKLGQNFFAIDLLRSSGADPANGGAGGAQEWYGFYKRGFSMNAMTGNKTGYGFIKDISLNARIDAGAKNTQFAPAPFKTRLGVSADMPVSAGFWSIGIDSYRESNHNGFATGAAQAVKFTPTYAITSAWAIPAGPGTIGGFFDRVGAKGLDGGGYQTKAETILRATYMLPVGGDKSGWKAGLGFEIWRNKFGNDASSTAAFQACALVSGSCNQSTALLLVEYHL